MHAIIKITQVTKAKTIYKGFACREKKNFSVVLPFKKLNDLHKRKSRFKKFLGNVSDKMPTALTNTDVRTKKWNPSAFISFCVFSALNVWISKRHFVKIIARYLTLLNPFFFLAHQLAIGRSIRFVAGRF